MASHEMGAKNGRYSIEGTDSNEQYVTLLENTTVFTNITNNNAFLSCVEFLLEVKQMHCNL